METKGFEREIVLRREISALQKKVAGLMEIQLQAELYRIKVLDEYKQLEAENKSLRRKLAQYE